MKSYSNLMFVLICVVFSPSSFADTYNIGKHTVNIPTPVGYIRVVPQMEGYFEIWNQMNPPGSENKGIVMFIESKHEQAALEGIVVPLDRFIFIQTLRKAQNIQFSSRDFKTARKELKSEVRKNYNSLCSSIEKTTGKSKDQINWDTDFKYVFEFTDMFNLPPYFEDENSIRTHPKNIGIGERSDFLPWQGRKTQAYSLYSEIF